MGDAGKNAGRVTLPERTLETKKKNKSKGKWLLYHVEICEK